MIEAFYDGVAGPIRRHHFDVGFLMLWSGLYLAMPRCSFRKRELSGTGKDHIIVVELPGSCRFQAFHDARYSRPPIERLRHFFIFRRGESLGSPVKANLFVGLAMAAASRNPHLRRRALSERSGRRRGPSGALVRAGLIWGAAWLSWSALSSQGAVWTETRFTASDGAATYGFGSSVAVSADGSTALVGSVGVDAGAVDQVGAAYVYRRNGTLWQETKLAPTDGGLRDWFGAGVALSADGNTALVGAPGDPGFPQPGAAYVYQWTGSAWSETKLAPGAPRNRFANSVSLSSDGMTIAAGSEDEDSRRGAAYVYQWNGSLWLEKRILASDGSANRQFGSAVRLSGDGDALIVGSRLDTVNGNFAQGSAYVYGRVGADWVEQKKLTASDGAASDEFGVAVALNFDGSRALVGSPFHDEGANDSQGKAYLFEGGTWVETKIVASDGSADDWFGLSVDLSADGQSMLVGSPAPTLSALHHSVVYLFQRNGTSWQEDKLSASDGAASDFFGAAAALKADSRAVIVGASNLTVGSNVGQGAAYLFTLPDTQPPVISSLSASPDALWPPNHKIVRVALTVDASDDTGVVGSHIVSVSSNEPDNSLGDGDTLGDIQVTGDLTLLLRAERSGKGADRVYTITVECEDAAGNASQASVAVTVPHS